MATQNQEISTQETISKNRKTFIGVVTSNKNDKTITVTVETSKIHPIYHKRFKSTKKYHAHDENNQANIGDVVEIMESRPLSALKRFRLVRIITNNSESK